MKTSDIDLKVNQNVYPDAVTCDRMRLFRPKSGQLGLSLFRAVAMLCSTNILFLYLFIVSKIPSLIKSCLSQDRAPTPPKSPKIP